MGQGLHEGVSVTRPCAYCGLPLRAADLTSKHLKHSNCYRLEKAGRKYAERARPQPEPLLLWPRPA